MRHLPTLLHETLTISSEQFPKKAALICNDQICTYQELDHQSSLLAGQLGQLGVNPGDRVAVFADNSIECVVSIYGILKAGGVFIVLNGSLKSSKLSFILDNSDAEVLICHASKSCVIAEAIQKLPRNIKIICVQPDCCRTPEIKDTLITWESIFTNHDKHEPYVTKEIEKHDLASLIYTSGSTGSPKGVMCSHHNMISAAGSIIEYLENTPDDIILNVLPLSFDYGLYQVLMSVYFGGTVVLENSFVYLHQILQRIEQHEVTGLPIVPTIVAMLLKMQNLKQYDFSSLRYLTNTGAAFPVNHIRQLREMLPDIQIFSMFGLTECKRVCYLPPKQIDIRPDSVGKAMPRCTTTVLGPDDRPVEPGQVGELVIEGPNVMQGYWKDEELTAKTFRSDGSPEQRRLYSGDYFKQDAEGYLYFLGRKDDMIKTRGERVSPREVENTLQEIDGIVEAAVIGVPDELLGQVIKGFVVLRDGCELSVKKILFECTKLMENFMVPKYIEIMEDLPKSHHGKIDKKELKKREKTTS